MIIINPKPITIVVIMLHLQVLGADVLGALVKAKLDQLKVHRVKTLLPAFCQSF